MTKKIILFFLLFLLLIGLVYALGPKAKRAQLNTHIEPLNVSLIQLEENILSEQKRTDVKPGNASKLIWANRGVKAKTRYAAVYLHGLSASPEEGAPLHEDFAHRYGMNLYIPRLYKHGLKTDEPLIDFTAEGYFTSVKEAIAIGRQLGEEVILIACSTGATAGLYIASEEDNIASLILIAPNISLANPASALIAKPWGKKILEQILGGKYQKWESTEEVKKYWYTRYRYEAIVELLRLINATMTPETFSGIDQPLFAGYYYKNEDEQDDVISVPAILNMYDQINTSDALKRKVAFANAGSHVISSPLMNPNYQDVLDEVYSFAEEILGLTPVLKIEPIMNEKELIPQPAQ